MPPSRKLARHTTKSHNERREGMSEPVNVESLLRAYLTAEIERSVQSAINPLVNERVRRAIVELDHSRAFTDKEVRELLGGISRSTLHTLRDVKHLLKSGSLYPGSRSRRTTTQQLQEYLAYLSSDEATATFSGEIGERRDARRRRVA